MLSKIKLHWQILIALILAVGFGYFAPHLVPYISWMGVAFLRGLNMVVVPLILSSIISGVARIGGGSNLGRLGARTFSYYLATSLIAILTGLFFVNVMQPGVGANLGNAEVINALPTANASVSDILMRAIPDNVFDAMAKGQILPVIFFAILFGAFITKIEGKKQEFLVSLFDSIFEVMMRITMFIIRFTPLGVFAIVAQEVAKNAASLGNIAGSLAIYIGRAHV